jgi:hypothetical protein
LLLVAAALDAYSATLSAPRVLVQQQAAARPRRRLQRVRSGRFLSICSASRRMRADRVLENAISAVWLDRIDSIAAAS